MESEKLVSHSCVLESIITFKMVHLCFWTILKRHFSLPQITNPSSIHLNSNCVVSNLQLSIDLQTAEDLGKGRCLQPGMCTRTFAITARKNLEKLASDSNGQEEDSGMG